MLKTEVYANLCGDWVQLNYADKIQGTYFMNWILRNDLHEFKEDYIGIVHGSAEYLIHKSCIQIKFVATD